ncbi:MAG: hypothetical protein NC177_03645 [Ruminococcus flavefaciens]|nr:hypothetical protein [Ruminococcus flavefaciens]
MKKIFPIVIKMLLRLYYFVNICVMLLSAYVVIEWIRAKIMNDGLALIGLIGMIAGHALVTLIVSVLIFIILTRIFLRNRKKQVEYEQELQKVSSN